MAELLVRLKDNTHPDPIKDLRGCAKKGYVITIKPDGWKWTENEGPPNFKVIKVPGVDPSKLEDLLKMDIYDPGPHYVAFAQEFNLHAFGATEEEAVKNLSVVANEAVKKYADKGLPVTYSVRVEEVPRQLTICMRKKKIDLDRLPSDTVSEATLREYVTDT